MEIKQHLVKQRELPDERSVIIRAAKPGGSKNLISCALCSLASFGSIAIQNRKYKFNFKYLNCEESMYPNIRCSMPEGLLLD